MCHPLFGKQPNQLEGWGFEKKNNISGCIFLCQNENNGTFSYQVFVLTFSESGPFSRWGVYGPVEGKERQNKERLWEG